MRDVLYSRCSYDKLPDRRLRLTIESEGERRWVFKEAATPDARPHLESLIARERRAQSYVGSRAEVLVGELAAGRVRYPYLDQPTLLHRIAEALEAADALGAWRELGRLLDLVGQLPRIEHEVAADPAFVGIYGPQVPYDGRVPCLSLGLVDLNPDNALVNLQSGRLTLIDHEILLDCPVPLEIVRFRLVFFTLLRLAGTLDALAGRVVLREVAAGLLRAPAAWPLADAVDESRIPALVGLEERFQAHFTGRLVEWPRPEATTRPPQARREPNIAQVVEEVRGELASKARSLEEAARRVEEANRSLEGAARKLKDYEAAFGEASRKLTEYERELGLTRAAERRAHRELLLAQQGGAQHAHALESEIEGLRGQVARLHVAASPRGVLRRGARLAAASIRRPAQVLKPRLAALAGRWLARARNATPASRFVPVKRWLKRAGRPLIRWAAVHTAAPVASPAPAPGGPTVRLVAAQGAPWGGPLFSVVLRSEALEEGREGTLRRLRSQTFASIEAVGWDRVARRAWLIDRPDAWWLVPNDGGLAWTLLGKYAVVGGDLAALPPAFLECNAIALEAERLDAVVNRPIASPLDLPSPQALLRGGFAGWPRVVRAEMLDDDLEVRLERLPPRGQPLHVVARVVSHPVRRPAVAEAPRDGEGGPELAAVGPWIVTRSPEAAWGEIVHLLHPVDSVLRPTPGPATRPRVLVLMPFLAVGGAETLMRDVLKRLGSDYDFLVATLEPADPSIGSMAPEYQEITPHVYLLPDLVPSALLFSALTYLIDAHAVDTLFVANGCSFIYDAAESLRARFPRLQMVNQVYDHQMGWIDRYDPGLARVFDRHIAVNGKVAQAYRERGVADERIRVVYHGIDSAEYDPARWPAERIAALRERLGLPADRPIVTFAARLHPQKRPLDFVALAQRFDPPEATFLIVGDGPIAPEVQRQMARARCPHLRRLPFHRPFVEVLALSDVMVVLSEYEGLPLVLLQSQAMGRPVVATDVGAIREVLDHTRGGVLLDRIGDVAAVERAVRQTLGSERPDPQGVRARLKERFDVEIAARGYGEALRRG